MAMKECGVVNPLLNSGGRAPGTIRFVLDPELPSGWCRYTGKDGAEYIMPLDAIPKGTVVSDMTIASDIWVSLHRYVQEASEGASGKPSLTP